MRRLGSKLDDGGLGGDAHGALQQMRELLDEVLRPDQPPPAGASWKSRAAHEEG
jgi:hypothetical protein